MNAHDDYKLLDVPPGGPALYDCPVCGSKASLWQYSESETTATTKAVMCTMGDAFGPQQGIVNEGCLLYMPPGEFYKSTIRDAIKFWNSYAVSLMKLQRSNRWKSAQILRDNGGPVERENAAPQAPISGSGMTGAPSK